MAGNAALNDIALTIDVDWAPDFVIDFVSQMLVCKEIRATWFVTHDSPSVRKLGDYPELFELGIHPNFLPGSTQGKTISEVLKYCLDIAPKANSMRTHSLVQSTPLLEEILNSSPICVDVSLFLPYVTFLKPFQYTWNGKQLLRVPYFWEDDFEMQQESPSWNCLSSLSRARGLKVFDFHPIYIYLNSSDAKSYNALKNNAPSLSTLERIEESFINHGAGTQSLFLQLIDYLVKQGNSYRIGDICQRWKSTSIQSQEAWHSCQCSG